MRNDPYWDEPLSPKEVCIWQKRSISWWEACRRLGIKVFAGRTTRRIVVEFLQRHPHPCSRKAK